MLKILKAPESYSCGLEDRFSPRMQRDLEKNGIPCWVRDIWADFWARHLFFSHLPYLYQIFWRGIAPLNCWIHGLGITREDVVWVPGTSLPVSDTACRFEKKIIENSGVILRLVPCRGKAQFLHAK